MTRALLIVLLVSSCAPGGDFCTVYEKPILFSGDVASQIVQTDRDIGEYIDTLNRYRSNVCSN